MNDDAFLPIGPGPTRFDSPLKKEHEALNLLMADNLLHGIMLELLLGQIPDKTLKALRAKLLSIANDTTIRDPLQERAAAWLQRLGDPERRKS